MSDKSSQLPLLTYSLTAWLQFNLLPHNPDFQQPFRSLLKSLLGKEKKKCCFFSSFPKLFSIPWNLSVPDNINLTSFESCKYNLLSPTKNFSTMIWSSKWAAWIQDHSACSVQSSCDLCHLQKPVVSPWSLQGLTLALQNK